MRKSRLQEANETAKFFCKRYVSTAARNVTEQLGHAGIASSDIQSILERARSTKLEAYAREGKVLGQGTMGKVVAAPPLDADLSSLLNHERGAIKVCDVEGGWWCVSAALPFLCLAVLAHTWLIPTCPCVRQVFCCTSVQGRSES
jgi:hypothetical protein